MNKKITIVIPTLNRPIDLNKAIISICNQKRLPDELVIVDQSDNQLSKKVTKLYLKSFKSIKLIYIHNSKIRGLVNAKQESLKHSTGELICFLEDDVVLEPDYVDQIEKGFSENPEMVGCCGVIINLPKNSLIYKCLFKVLHWGIFKDPRFGILDRVSITKEKFVVSQMLSGGNSAWRQEVFDLVNFDVLNGFHMFEDVDFSTRVFRAFEKRLFINTGAKLAHYYSPINRDFFGDRQRRKVMEAFIFYKKRKDWSFAFSSFICLLLAMLLEALAESFVNGSLKSISGFILGCRDGVRKKVLL